MKPLFTIHAGEYLVGSHIEQQFRRVNVWVPSRDTGVDLLVSDRRNRRAVSLQVKFSKDFLVTHMGPVFQKDLRSCGWWTIDQNKLQDSPADFWVFVLHGFATSGVVAASPIHSRVTENNSELSVGDRRAAMLGDERPSAQGSASDHRWRVSRSKTRVHEVAQRMGSRGTAQQMTVRSNLRMQRRMDVGSDYAYLVPYVESESEIFPKSIIPSRKATRDFLSGDT
jgi:hypothetical protein